MIYDIKAIPTTYAGVRFRSRLEARWAAFFDLAKIQWQYEPFDLDGWAPDFLLKLPIGNVLVEVKPFDIRMKTSGSICGDALWFRAFEKAISHSSSHPVLTLGFEPRTPSQHGIGVLCNDGRPGNGPIEMHLIVVDTDWKWREAGNAVQWNA